MGTAREIYEETLTIARELSLRDPNNTQFQRDLAGSLRELACLNGAQGNIAAARRLSKESADIYRCLAKRLPDDMESQINVSVVISNLGEAHRMLGDLRRPGNCARNR